MTVSTEAFEKLLDKAVNLEVELRAERERADALATAIGDESGFMLDVSERLHKAERERDALAAHVERLRSALNYSSEYLDGSHLNSIGHGSKAHMEMVSALKEAPETILAQRDARVAAETYDELAYDLEQLDPQFDDVHYVAVSDMRGRAEELRRIGCREKARAYDEIAAGGGQ